MAVWSRVLTTREMILISVQLTCYILVQMFIYLFKDYLNRIEKVSSNFADVTRGIAKF